MWSTEPSAYRPFLARLAEKFAKRLDCPRSYYSDLPKGRADKALVCLYNLITAAKNQADIATWLNESGQDLEDFFDALRTGADHPILRRWKARRATHRQPPDTREQHTRRLVLLMCTALKRAQLLKGGVHKFAAKKLAQVLPNVSDDAIRQWERGEAPLAEADEQVIANAIERCDRDHERLAIYFVKLIQIAAVTNE